MAGYPDSIEDALGELEKDGVDRCLLELVGEWEALGNYMRGLSDGWTSDLATLEGIGEILSETKEESIEQLIAGFEPTTCDTFHKQDVEAFKRLREVVELLTTRRVEIDSWTNGYKDWPVLRLQLADGTTKELYRSEPAAS
jgi:hypothetical protein